MRPRAAISREFGSLVSDTRPVRPTPFLKWAGGKAQLLEQMRPFFPRAYETYFEPFLGGGAVFFSLMPEKAVLSDLNPELITVFLAVRADPDGFMDALDVHLPHRGDRRYYYLVRDKIDPEKLNFAERAARTVFLNKTCYNGLYRVNSSGHFNVPFGRHVDPALYDRENILAASGALRNKIITIADYRSICRYAREGDFVYLDPPYQPRSETAKFTSYTRGSFGESDQQELAEIYEELDGVGCKVMLSNSTTETIRTLYREYRQETVNANRAISCKAGSRGRVTELLILNY